MERERNMSAEGARDLMQGFLVGQVTRLEVARRADLWMSTVRLEDEDWPEGLLDALTELFPLAASEPPDPRSVHAALAALDLEPAHASIVLGISTRLVLLAVLLEPAEESATPDAILRPGERVLLGTAGGREALRALLDGRVDVLTAWLERTVLDPEAFLGTTWDVPLLDVGGLEGLVRRLVADTELLPPGAARAMVADEWVAELATDSLPDDSTFGEVVRAIGEPLLESDAPVLLWHAVQELAIVTEDDPAAGGARARALPADVGGGAGPLPVGRRRAAARQLRRGRRRRPAGPRVAAARRRRLGRGGARVPGPRARRALARLAPARAALGDRARPHPLGRRAPGRRARGHAGARGARLVRRPRLTDGRRGAAAILAAMATLPDDVRELLDGPNFVHVASTLPDGAPHVVAIWAGVERGPDGDRIVFFTGPATRKARNLDRDGRVAFSVVGHDDPYRTAWVRGRVVEKRVDDLETMDHLSHVYTGQPFPNRTNVVYVVEPERWKYLHLPFSHEPGA